MGEKIPSLVIDSPVSGRAMPPAFLMYLPAKP
jgi:hypothetical protein